MRLTRTIIGRTAATSFALGAAIVLSGCADLAHISAFSPAPIDPTSPAAEQVRAASRADYKTPSFRDIPPKPADVRPARSFRAAVAENTQAREAVTAWLAANPATLAGTDTEDFAQGRRATIPAGEREPIPDPAGTEAFAARLRALAAPPPPPQ